MLKFTEPTVDEAAMAVRAGRFAARLAGADLDAESLEMITAALMADACDEISPAED
jgi:hypothetical protein